MDIWCDGDNRSFNSDIKRLRSALIELGHAVSKASTNEAQRYHLMMFWEIVDGFKEQGSNEASDPEIARKVSAQGGGVPPSAGKDKGVRA